MTWPEGDLHYIRVNATVGKVQSEQGEEGCWAELLNAIRSKAGLYSSQQGMFIEGGYELAMDRLCGLVVGLPPLQTEAYLTEIYEQLNAITEGLMRSESNQ